MKYKVLHIVGPMNTGGTETMLMNIYRNIDRDKIQFDFLSFSQEEAYYDKEIKALGGKVIKISNPKSIREISNVIKNNGPYKVVHAHTLFNCGFAMIAAKINNIEIRISHAHTNLDDESKVIRRMYVKLMRKIINKYSTKLLACSNAAGCYLFGSKTLNTEKYSYFPNLVDYKKMMTPNKEKVKLFKMNNDLNNNLVIGNIGTLKPSKNQEFLLKIVKILKERHVNVKLIIVGDGELKSRLKELTEEYDIVENVIFTGIRKDINNMLSCMDVFVLPSIYEGLGLVLLEAQASGLPCLVSEAIQKEADLGLNLIEKLNLSDDEILWADKIVELSSKKKLSRYLIEEKFNDKGYSTSKCISRLLEIYEVQL